MSEIKVVNGVSISTKTDAECVKAASKMSETQALSVFFNTQEKRRAALEFIQKDRRRYNDSNLYKEEEKGINAINAPVSNVQSAPDEYIEKKLNLFYYEDDENDETITEDKDFEAVLALVNTVEDCQKLINILLEHIAGFDFYHTDLLMEKYGCKKFDTIQEVRKLVLALEIKKAQLKTDADVSITPTSAVYDKALAEIDSEINSELDDNLIRALFDSPEKCQAAIDVILFGQEDITKYVNILKKLEAYQKEAFPGCKFTAQQRIEMIAQQEYILKELDVILMSESTSNKKDKWTVDYYAYRRTLKSVDSAAECQIMIDKLLDEGWRGHFDTPNEVKGLLLALEMKKKEFDEKEIKKVEDPKNRKERQTARELNNYVWQILHAQSLSLSEYVNQAIKEIGAFEYSGLYWHSVFTGKTTLGELIKGKNDPYEQLCDIYFKFSNAVTELGSYKDTASIDEFGAKINALLANGNYDVELVKKTIKTQKAFQEAKVLEQINAVKSLPYSPENIIKMEKALGGRNSIISQLGSQIDYANATDSQKYEYLQKLLEANSQILSEKLEGKTLSQISKEFDDTHIAFLKMLGVTNVQEELQAFRERTEIAGGVTRGIVVISASILTGGIAGAGAVTTGVVTGATSFGTEVYDKATDGVENLSSVGDWGVVIGHGVVDGFMVGSSMKATAAIVGSSANPMTKIGATFITDGAIGTAGAGVHALVDGRALTKEDVALNFGISAVGSALGARGLFKGYAKAAPRSQNVAIENARTSLYGQQSQHPMYRQARALNPDETRINTLVARDCAESNVFAQAKNPDVYSASAGSKGIVDEKCPICINGQFYKFEIPDNSTRIIRGEDLTGLGVAEIKLSKAKGVLHLEVLKGEIGIGAASIDDFLGAGSTIHKVNMLATNKNLKITTNGSKPIAMEELKISPQAVNPVASNAGRAEVPVTPKVDGKNTSKVLETGEPVMISENVKISIDDGKFLHEFDLNALQNGESILIGNVPGKAEFLIPEVEFGTLMKATRVGNKIRVERYSGNIKVVYPAQVAKNPVPATQGKPSAPSAPKKAEPMATQSGKTSAPVVKNTVKTPVNTVKQEVIFPEWGNIEIAGKSYDVAMFAEQLQAGESVIVGNTAKSVYKIATSEQTPVAIKITKHGAGYKVENLAGKGFKYDKHNIAVSALDSEVQAGTRVIMPDGREFTITESLLKGIKEGKSARVVLNSKGKPVISSSSVNYNAMSITIQKINGKFVCVNESWEGVLLLK